MKVRINYMRRKKGSNGIFIIFVIIAIVIATVLMMILPEAVSQFKQLIFFGTVIVVSAIQIAIFRKKKH